MSVTTTKHQKTAKDLMKPIHTLSSLFEKRTQDKGAIS